ncbi:MAG: hypothetical protein AAGF20_04975, partial [Pseudomonadota bacterium]
CVCTAAQAQVKSEGMGDISAWGARYLNTGEPEFPPDVWSRSDDETLLSLMQEARTLRMSPAERQLLRRVVLSPATAPRGDQAEALLSQRARLMLALGEARAAAALAPKLKPDARSFDAETLAVDLDMASGREASACARARGPLPEGEYWLKLRAVCAALRENFTGAELAVEVATAQGLRDPWFVEAIFAASGTVPNPPFARFDTGLHIALSSKANLDTSRVTLSSNRPDLAAAAAQRQGVPVALKARFAEIASEIDLISPQNRREILLEQLGDEDYTPATQVEQTLAIFQDNTASAEVLTDRLASTLRSSARRDFQRYAADAALLKAELQALAPTSETARHAMTFARATLVTGDSTLARRWLGALEYDGAAKPEAFQLAVFEATDLMTRGTRNRTAAVEAMRGLIETATTPQHKRQAAHLLTLWTAFDEPLPPNVRSFILSQKEQGQRLPAEQLVALKAAALADAKGEVSLMVLVITDGAAQRLNASDLAALLVALRQIGAEDIARQFVLETSGVWLDGPGTSGG